MDRRGFLLSTLAGGVGGLAASRPASALQVVSCDAEAGSPGCRRLKEHEDFLARVDTMLDEQGATEAQRRAVLAAASCPVCGMPLLGHRRAGGF